MYVVLLEYRKPLAEIDRLMPSHVRFLEQCYNAGVFVVSGRRVPRHGGIILARNTTLEQLTELMSLDPFVREEAASFEILEFKTSLHHPDFAPFADAGTRAVRLDP